MAERIRRHDWAATPIGPPERWPQSLHTLVMVILGANQPMFIAWGTERTLLYNDPYVEVLAAKHPALGRDLLEVWKENRDDLEPLVASAYRGEASHMDDLELVMHRKGYPEVTHWAYSYTPIYDEQGQVAGFFCPCHEITAQILADRRKEFLRQLGDALHSFDDARDAMAAAVEQLGRHLKANRVGYGEVQPDGRTVVLHTCFVDGVQPLYGAFPMDSFGPEQIAAQRQGLTSWSDDLARDPTQDMTSWAPIETRAFASVPLVRGGRFVASIYVNFREPHHWTPDEITVIEEVGARTWSAVERASAESKLRENEERLRLATENAEVGFWDVDQVRDVLHWPPLVKGMFGISAGEPVTMQDFYNGLHPEDRDPVTAAFAGACDPARRALYDVEYRVIGKEDGRLRWVAAKGRGFFDDVSGKCLRVTGVAIEITSRKTAEAALAESQSRLRDLNETLERRVAERTRERDQAWRNSRDLQVVMDNEGRFRAANDAVRAILGYNPEEVTGRSYLDFVHPDDAASSAALASPKSGPLPTFENRYRHADGHWRWISWLAAPENGLIYASGRDVTEEKQRQAELDQAQASLRQAQKMEAVGQLTGGIAHDFNNLLQGVAGNLDLIRRKPEDRERVQRWAAAGLKAAERGARLTGQLLAFSRAQKMELKPIALSSLVSGFREMIERTMVGQIRLSFDLEPEGLRVIGDETQIEMAVLNLALNARDAMPGGGQLTITTKPLRVQRSPEIPDGDYVELAVRDTGSGMSPEVVARAFDPFYTTKGPGKGTGLGLSQVYGAVRQAGGAVRIDSRIGEGTTVRLFLQRTHAVGAGETKEPLESGRREISARILVVDDDPDVRRFLAESLQASGFVIIEAEDGQAGLAALERSAPDVMIVDYAMPGLNGVEVARLAKDKRPDLPIIFATGYAESAAIEKFGGPDALVLRKPFRVDELLALLASTLDR